MCAVAVGVARRRRPPRRREGWRRVPVSRICAVAVTAAAAAAALAAKLVYAAGALARGNAAAVAQLLAGGLADELRALRDVGGALPRALCVKSASLVGDLVREHGEAAAAAAAAAVLEGGGATPAAAQLFTNLDAETRKPLPPTPLAESGGGGGGGAILAALCAASSDDMRGGRAPCGSANTDADVDASRAGLLGEARDAIALFCLTPDNHS